MKLAVKLNLLLVSIVVFGLTGVVFFLYKIGINNIKGFAQDQQLVTTQQVMDTLDRVLYERYQDILQISEISVIESYVVDKGLVEKEVVTDDLNKLLTSTGPWNDLHVVDVNGKTLASSGFQGLYAHDNQSLQVALSKVLDGEVYYTGVVEHLGQLTIMFAAPVKNEALLGKPVVGAVIGHFAWPVLQELLESTGFDEVYLLNSQFKEIGSSLPGYRSNHDHSNLDDLMTLSSGSLEAVSLNTDELHLVSYVKQSGFLQYKGSDWILVSETPVSKVMALAKGSIRLLLIGISGTGLVLLMVFWVFIYKVIIGPILSLTKFTEAISSGDLKARVELNSKDEIGRLASSFNEMAHKLQDVYVDLEQKVKEKTVELQGRVNELDKTKGAMINLLEDAKELEEELKVEKAGVEKKVLERTAELRREKTKLTTSINSLSLGFVLTNKKDEIVLSNQALLKMFDLKDDKDLGMILEKIFGLKGLCQKCRQTNRPMEKKNVEVKGRFFRLFINPVKGETVVAGTVVLIEDVTEAKVLERSKAEFFSIASHELRTPLTAIRGNADMILEYYADQVKNPDLKEMINDIHESSVRLIDIVNDFLDVGRLEQGRLEFKLESFDMTELVDQAIRQYQVTGSRKKLYINLEKPKVKLPLVYADKDKSRQVLLNLIGNAIKFTQEGGVTVSLGLEDKLLKVMVTDTGKGIALENQKLLFHKFQQASSSLYTRDATKGTGLGLYISRLLLRDMGGKIELVKSEVGKGSTFGFSLPIES